MKRKIDFCIVGPQRTSTSWIYEKLKNSQQLNLPTKVKETFFFDKKFNKGLDYYFSLFESFDENKITGEIGPTYFHNIEAISRISKVNSECKIIIIFRDPIEKSISLYKHHYRKGRVGKDFKNSINKIPDILESGKYSKYNKKWSETFGSNNILILDYKELSENPQYFLNRITKFLNIEPIKIDVKVNKRVNQGTTPRFFLLAKLFAKLVAFLRKYDFHNIVELGKKIGLKSVYSGGKDERDFKEERIWLKDQFEKEDFLF